MDDHIQPPKTIYLTFCIYRDLQYLQALNNEIDQDTQKGIFGLK